MKYSKPFKVVTLSLITALSSCGPNRADSSPPPVGSVNEIPYQTEESASDNQLSSSAVLNELRTTERLAYLDKVVYGLTETSACDFWNSLNLKEGDDLFQIVTDLRILQGSNANNTYGGTLGSIGSIGSVSTSISKDRIYGRHIPARLPHLMYFLSQENDEERFLETLNKLHNPPTADQVRDFIRKNGTWTQRKFLWTQNDEDIIESRNEKIVEGLEALLPGVLSGKENTLAGKVAFETLEPFIKATNLNRTHFAALSILNKKVPLFGSPSWPLRERELRQSLAILDRPFAEGLSLAEKVCHFAIYHRVVAQLIKIKGVENAPLLTKQGLLEALPTIDIDPATGKQVPLDVADIEGLFQEKNSLNEWKPVVVTTDWVSQKVEDLDAGQEVHIRIKDPINLKERLGALRYLVTLTAYRNNRLFDVFKDAPDSRPRVIKKLQKMGIAMFGLALHTVEERDFPTGEGIDLEKARFNFLKENTADNVAYLLHTVIEAIESLERLREAPDKVDRELLTPSQMESFAGTDNKKGVVDCLEDLLMLLVVESKSRIDENKGSAQLKFALDRAIVHAELR
ncbi:hypothetical protein GW915_05350 [bacterium]|nr:hypothetical protein [bacterium]